MMWKIQSQWLKPCCVDVFSCLLTLMSWFTIFCVRISRTSQHYGLLLCPLSLQRSGSRTSGWGRFDSFICVCRQIKDDGIAPSCHTFSHVGLGPSFGHGISQWWEGKSCSSYFTSHVLCFPLPEEPQVTTVAGLLPCLIDSWLMESHELSFIPSCSAYNMPSFQAGSQLLSSLSGYAYTKRAWRKEVFELFMDPLFFTMDSSCAHRWLYILCIIDTLFIPIRGNASQWKQYSDTNFRGTSVHSMREEASLLLLTVLHTDFNVCSLSVMFPVVGNPLLITCWLTRRPCLKTSWVSTVSRKCLPH